MSSAPLAEPARHIGNPLRIENFPTEPERAAWLKQKTKLESAVAAAVAERNAKRDVWARLRAQWFAAAKEFDRLCFIERINRGPVPQPKALAGLAGVR